MQAVGEIAADMSLVCHQMASTPCPYRASFPDDVLRKGGVLDECGLRDRVLLLHYVSCTDDSGVE